MKRKHRIFAWAILAATDLLLTGCAQETADSESATTETALAET